MAVESGERAALVSGHGLYTEESGGGSRGGGEEEEEEDGGGRSAASASAALFDQDNILGQFHEDALSQVGVGSYQWLICATAGFCFMSDGCQTFMAAYLVPSIQAEMCLDDRHVHYLSCVPLVGLVFGALICPLADHMGRRSLLVFALIVHLLFNISAAFTPTLGVFLTTRFTAAVGLGMCYPVACVYLAEFLPRAARGRLSWLLVFWALGGFYAVLLAYFLVPPTGEAVVMEKCAGHSGWRRSLLLSCLPSVLALASLLCTSESARFLLHSGKDVNAIMVYQQMYKWNASRSAQYQLTELELPSKPVCAKQPPAKTVWAQIVNNVNTFTKSMRQLGQRQNLISIVLLSLVWTSLGFSFFGLGQWIPSKIQEIKNEAYNQEVEVSRDGFEKGELYVTRLENMLFVNVTFDSCTFARMKMSHVTFQGCFFENTDFSNVVSSRTYFLNSTVENCRFVDTDLTEDRFRDCELVNNSVLTVGSECRTDVDFNLCTGDLIKENLIRLVQPLLALAVAALCLGNVNKSAVGVCSMLVCSLSSLSTWLLESVTSVWIFDAFWSFFFVFCFNAANVITTESFPVHLRCTGVGTALAWARLGGLGGWAWSEAGAAPALPTAASLLLGGVALFALPDSSARLV